MNKWLLSAAFLAAVGAASATSHAANVTLDFGSLPIGGHPACAVDCVLPTGGLNSVLDGVSVEGYNASNISSFLTQKPATDGADETGIGQSDSSTTSSDPEFEIAINKFVVVDNVIADKLGFTPVSFTIGSLQNGEQGKIFGYTGPDGSPELVPGDLTLLHVFTGPPGLQTFNVQGDGFDKFVFTSIPQIGATTSNVLVASEVLAAPAIPETRTWAMMLIGFGLMGLVGRKFKQRLAMY